MLNKETMKLYIKNKIDNGEMPDKDGYYHYDLTEVEVDE